MRKVTGWLHETGDWHRKNDEYTGFSPTSIHYRMWLKIHNDKSPNYDTDEHGEVFLGRDRILCPDMPMRLRKVDISVNCLSGLQKKCVMVKFFSPLDDDNRPFTNRQLALSMGKSLYAFKKNVSRGVDRVAKLLSEWACNVSD